MTHGNCTSEKNPAARLEKTALVLVTLLLVSIPLIRKVDTTFAHTSGSRISVCLLELGLVLAIVCNRQVRWPAIRSVPIWGRALVAIWCFWGLLATLAADHFALALVRQVEWWSGLAMAVSLYSFLSTYPRYIRRLHLTILFGFLFYVGFFVVSEFEALSSSSTPPRFPGFSNIRHFGYYALWIIPFGLGPLATLRKLPKNFSRGFAVLGGATAVVAFAMMLFSGGRGPLLGLAVAAAGMLLLGLVRVSWRTSLITMSLFVFGTIGAMAVPGEHLHMGLGRITRSLGLADFMLTTEKTLNVAPAGQPLQSQVTASNNLVSMLQKASSGRLDIWKNTLRDLQGRIWLGVGPDGYMFLSHPGAETTVQPHSFLVQCLVEWGIVGAMAAWAMIGVILWRVRRTIRFDREAPDNLLRVSAVGGLLATLGLGLVDGPLYHAFPLMLFFVTVVLSQVSTRTDISDWQSISFTARRVWVTTAVAFSLVILLHSQVQRAERRGGDSRLAEFRMQLLRMFPSREATRKGGVFARAAAELDTTPEKSLDWARFGAQHSRRPYHFQYMETLALLRLERYSAAENVALRALSNHLPQQERYQVEGDEPQRDALEALTSWMQRGLLDGTGLRVDDEGLISTIKLSGSSLGDGDIERLLKIWDLTEIVLSGGDYSEVGLTKLAGLRSLRKLTIADRELNTAVTGALNSIPKLKQIVLTDVAFTTADLKQLRLGIPGVSVEVKTSLQANQSADRKIR